VDYRGYLVLSDLTAIGLFAGAAVAKGGTSTALGIGGVGMYALGAPMIHSANDEGGRAALSLGLRLGLPVVFGGIGYVLGEATCHEPPPPSSDDPADDTSFGCGFSGVAVGALGVFGGMLGAILVDDLALGRVKLDRRASTSQSGASRRATSRTFAQFRWELSPFVAPRGQGGGMLLIGTF
jgi:hypothetical protein